MADLIVSTRVTFVATFRDEAGALIDPSSVTWTVRKPDGSLLDPVGSGTHPSTGVYKLPVTLNESGRWKVEAQGDGTVIVAGDLVVSARKSAVDKT